MPMLFGGFWSCVKNKAWSVFPSFKQSKSIPERVHTYRLSSATSWDRSTTARGQARLDRVALANLESITLAVFTRAQQQVHARLLQLGPVGHAGLRPGRTRKHQRTTHPVGPLDNAQAIRVAVGDEDAE